jgi:hypothetical protein
MDFFTLPMTFASVVHHRPPGRFIWSATAISYNKRFVLRVNRGAISTSMLCMLHISNNLEPDMTLMKSFKNVGQAFHRETLVFMLTVSLSDTLVTFHYNDIT